MNQLEIVREECAQIADYRNTRIAEEIRNMPLPESPDVPQSRIKDHTLGKWFIAHSIDEMSAFYFSRLSAIRNAARELGYAIGLHGSTRRDFDLMAVAWTEDCATPEELAHVIAAAACGITRGGSYEWETKPQGRVATSIPICWTDYSSNLDKNDLSLGHIDLSVVGHAKPEIADLQAEHSLLLAVTAEQQRVSLAGKYALDKELTGLKVRNWNATVDLEASKKEIKALYGKYEAALTKLKAQDQEQLPTLKDSEGRVICKCEGTDQILAEIRALKERLS